MNEFFIKYAEEIKSNNLDVEFIEEGNVLRSKNCEFYMELYTEDNYIQIHRRSPLVYMPFVTVADCNLDIYGNSIYITKK